MADLATPSAATMSTANAGADASQSATQQANDRPSKPDDEAYKANLEKADKILDQAKKRVADAQSRVNSSIPGKSETAPRQNEIREQLNAIKSKQAASKSSRQQSLDKVKSLDAQMKAKINEQKTAKASSPFKSTAEIDAEIKRLEASVESGKLKMVDERKAVAEVSSLHKQKKGFGALDERQREIDGLKNSIAELKKREDRPEQRELEAEYDKLNKERETLRNADLEKRGDINAARDALKEARDKQSEAWAERKKLQDEYYTSKSKYREYEREAAKVRDAKRKAERDEYARTKRQENLERKLEEASLPAYGDEIRAADSIIHLIDPSSASVASAAVAAVSEFAAKAQRLVDDSGIKGTRLSSKKDEEEDAYFVGGGGKKGKKNKKSKTQPTSDTSSSTPSAANRDLFGKLWAPSALEQFSILKLDSPATPDDIPKVLEQVKSKRQFYLDDRDRKTKENIDNAHKEFDAYEADPNKPSSARANGTAAKGGAKREPASETKPTTNGDATSTSTTEQKDATADVSKDLQNASLNDAKVEPDNESTRRDGNEDAHGADTENPKKVDQRDADTVVDAASNDVQRAEQKA